MKQALQQGGKDDIKSPQAHDDALPRLKNTEGLIGNCGYLDGDARGISGNVAKLAGSFDACELTDADRDAGIDVATLTIPTPVVDTATKA